MRELNDQEIEIVSGGFRDDNSGFRRSVRQELIGAGADVVVSGAQWFGQNLRPNPEDFNHTATTQTPTNSTSTIVAR